MKNNPYVGPRPYERRDRHNFYGREREARELRSLILSEREVLFYAQSGAGKTSLLNATVIPMLKEEDFYVLPVARVGNELPPGIDPTAVDNIFVFSALLSLARIAIISSKYLRQKAHRYRIVSPLSPVRILTASMTSYTKILPSPRRPVAALSIMASMALSRSSSLTITSILIFGRKSTVYSLPR